MSDKNGGEATSIIDTDATKVMNSNPLDQKLAGILEGNPLDYLVGATIGKFANNNAEIRSSFDPNSTLGPKIDKAHGGSIEKIGLKQR